MKNLKLVVVIVAVAMLFASAVMAGGTGATTDITQGEFAVLLAGSLAVDPPGGGWDASSAVSELTSMGITPLTGSWDSGAVLTEGDLVHIAKFFGVSTFTETPDAPVSVSKAKAFMFKNSTYFKTAVPTTMNNDPETATHIYLGVGETDAPAAPASPIVP